MDFDANIKILGKETVADVGILVKAISADRGRTAEGNAALVDLLLTMVADLLAPGRADAGFSSRVDQIVQRLRSTCMSARDVGGGKPN